MRQHIHLLLTGLQAEQVFPPLMIWGVIVRVLSYLRKHGPRVPDIGVDEGRVNMEDRVVEVRVGIGPGPCAQQQVSL